MLEGKRIRIEAKSETFAAAKSTNQSLYLSLLTNNKQIRIGTSCPILYVDAEDLIEAIQELLGTNNYDPKHAKSEGTSDD